MSVPRPHAPTSSPRGVPVVRALRAVPPPEQPVAPPARAVSLVLDVPSGAGYPQDHELVELAEILREMAHELAPWVSGARVSLTSGAPTPGARYDDGRRLPGGRA